MYVGAFHRLTANYVYIQSTVDKQIFQVNLYLIGSFYQLKLFTMRFLKILTKFLVLQNENKRQIEKEKFIY